MHFFNSHRGSLPNVYVQDEILLFVYATRFEAILEITFSFDTNLVIYVSIYSHFDFLSKTVCRFYSREYRHIFEINIHERIEFLSTSINLYTNFLVVRQRTSGDLLMLRMPRPTRRLKIQAWLTS